MALWHCMFSVLAATNHCVLYKDYVALMIKRDLYPRYLKAVLLPDKYLKFHSLPKHMLYNTPETFGHSRQPVGEFSCLELTNEN